MYQRFKNCLLKPRNIADYIKEPSKKTVIYTIILLIVYVIPFILISLLSKSAVTTLTTGISEDFISSEQINYNIEDGKLVSTTVDETPQYIKTDFIIQDIYKVNALLVFDTTGNEYKDILDVESNYYLVLLFTENEFKISTIEVIKNEHDEVIDGNNNIGVELSVDNTSSNMTGFNLLSYTYEKLGITNVKFSSNKDNNTVNFKNDIATVVDAIYGKIQLKLLPLIIISVLVLAVGSYFFSILFITVIFKLLYRYLHVDFKVVFKATILSSTPYVICSIIAVLTNITFLEIVGEFIMILYVTKAITSYKIKYDGGIPLPRYMQNMMNDKKDEEKGSDDDEL